MECLKTRLCGDLGAEFNVLELEADVQVAGSRTCRGDICQRTCETSTKMGPRTSRTCTSLSS